MNASHRVSRRAVLALAGTAAFPALAQSAAGFPSKFVRIVVGYGPGGPPDLLARAIAHTLSESWKQPVIVENKAGAGGSLGAEIVARSAPDGHILLLAPLTHSIVPSLMKLPFDAMNDFQPVTLVGQAPLVLVVHPSFPANNVKELIEQAKAKPGQLVYASAGNGTSTHIIGEMLKRTAGVDILHVPYKGSGAAVIDVMAGRANMYFDTLASSLPHIRSGKLKPLTVLSPKRSTQLPDLPTMAESGYPGFEVAGWLGVFAPAKMPRPLLATINSAINATIDSPMVKNQLAAMGAESVGTTPEEFERVVRRDMQRFGAIIKDTGIRVD